MAKGTEIYLESFEGNKTSKTKQTFQTIPNHKDNLTTKFIPNSGPEAAQNFPNKNVVGDGADKPEFSQGTENAKKAPSAKLNNSGRTKLMSEKAINTNTSKSEFDRLCEEVLGPEEVDLGIEAPAGEGDDAMTDGDKGCAECSLGDRLRNLITEIEGILAEVEGTSPEGAPAGDGSEDHALTDDGATPGGAVKEAVEAEDLGTPLVSQKSGKPMAVTGRANVVDGDASKIKKSTAATKGDGGARTGVPESAPDGEAQVGKPKQSQAVKGTITGKNQPMFGT